MKNSDSKTKGHAVLARRRKPGKFCACIANAPGWGVGGGVGWTRRTRDEQSALFGAHAKTIAEASWRPTST
jgi:hypothetical protein